jgi:asparagine synthase (glutamine-hydrolysing)
MSMCGIAGLVQRTRNDALRMRFIRHAQDLLRSRGPDAQTFACIDDRVSLVHTRLSIIDLASGAQPMQDDKGAIVFNGEIYN